MPVKPKVVAAPPDLKIVKPKQPGFLDRFKSKQPPTIEGVGTALNPLKVMRISEAKDFVRLHPDEDEFWSPELCFVSVPIKGQNRDMLHLIDENVALPYAGTIQLIRYRLALASKPHDVLFFCMVPSQNLENAFNDSALRACHEAQGKWVKAVSRKKEGHDDYKITYARDPDAFPAPNWGPHTFEAWSEITFKDASIDTNDHPGLLRLIGAKQTLG